MPTPSRRLRLPIFALLLIAVGVGVFFWKPWKKPEKPAVDMEAIARLNNRGIGVMDQMTKFDEAAAIFQEVVDKAPDWRPGKVNLGIALLNTAEPANLDKATAVFKELLAADPNDAHANYNLGIILSYRGQLAESAPYFEAVTRIDPADAQAWYKFGDTHPKGRESPEAKAAFRKALERNPYMRAARYAVAMQEPDQKKKETLLAEMNALGEANWESPFDIKYTEMGKYGDLIGRDAAAPRPAGGPLPMFAADPQLKVTLPEGVTWEGIGLGLRVSHEPVGGAMTLLDFDRDGKPDVFLPMAVVEKGRVRNLLLHNEGNGAFRDVTREYGLIDSPSCSAACVGDFNNDGFPDLILAGYDRVALYRNNGGKGFTDVTAAAGLGKLNGFCRSCLWVDIDQDGDLDLVLAFDSWQEGGMNGLVVMLNVGEAPPMGPQAKDAPPLTAKFKRCETLPKEVTGKPVTAVMIADLDGDRDVDLLVTIEGQPRPVYNDRLLRFHVGPPAAPAGKTWLAGLALTTQRDDRSEVLMLAKDGPPVLLSADDTPAVPKFTADALAGPRLMQAVAFDIDLDGATDIVGLTAPEAGKPARPALLHNEGGKFVAKDDPFGPADGFPPDIIAVAVVDIDGDCQPDLLYWSEGKGLGWRRNLGNGNRAVRVAPSGRQDKGNSLRTNADGIGCRVWALAGQLSTSVEHVTLSSGPGQSLLPLTLGIGKNDAADVIRIRWPDGVPQAEPNRTACESHRVAEMSRKQVSCPVLMTWDGEKFAYVTDCLGGGSVGEMTADGSYRAPRPEESLQFTARQLKPKDGQYVLKLAEPMDEVMYLDRARLTAIDHPADWKVFPDERFSDPPPSQELLAFRNWLLPKTARDHRGADITAKVRDRDGKTADTFARRSWLGFAEDHSVELDFGETDAKPGQRWFLVLHGWTDYPYPESIFAADQAGVKMQAPLLERTNAKGEWEAVGEIGFPAGLPKTMTAEVTGKLPPAGGKFRIRTNLQIYWDQIALAPLEAVLPADEPTPSPTPGVKVHHAKMTSAHLAHRGFMREIPPAGPTDPVAYDDSKTETVAVTKWKGKLTRTGDVTELLNVTDDRHVICGPGDEVTVRFAADLPPVPDGWERTFVLRTWGYCKDSAPFTGTSGNVHPLPFRAMPKYPYGADVKVPPALLDYDRKWNTRPMTAGW